MVEPLGDRDGLRRELVGPAEVAQPHERHRERVLELGLLDLLLGGAEQREGLGRRPDRALRVVGLEPGLGQGVEVDPALAQVEAAGEVARLLEVQGAARRVAVLGLELGEGDPHPHLEVRVLDQGRVGPEHRLQQAPGLLGIVERHVHVGEPVLRALLVGGAAAGLEQADRLDQQRRGGLRLVQLAVGLGRAQQQLAAGDAVRGQLGEVLVGLRGLGEPAGRQVEVGVEPAPASGVVGDQAVRGRAQARREIVERGHRRLRVPELERAHVRLGVAVARELLLGQPGGEAGGTDAPPDRACELTMIDDDATALAGFDDVHAADHTTRSTSGRPSAPRSARKTWTGGCRPG